jgi:hypothetical protein
MKFIKHDELIRWQIQKRFQQIQNNIIQGMIEIEQELLMEILRDLLDRKVIFEDDWQHLKRQGIPNVFDRYQLVYKDRTLGTVTHHYPEPILEAPFTSGEFRVTFEPFKP